MSAGQRDECQWEGLSLVVEAHSDFWQAFVYDPNACEVLYTGARIRLGDAKAVAIDFVATRAFGESHDLEPAIISDVLLWERA